MASLYGRPGDNPVDIPVELVLTRFGLKRSIDLFLTHRKFEQVLSDARVSRTPGLLQSAFLIENRHTCLSLSIWTSRDVIPHFGTATPSHVDAARWIFGRCRPSSRQDGPEVWSTKWRLSSVSNNLNWGDFDLREFLEKTSHDLAN
jgi:hypothetical protein